MNHTQLLNHLIAKHNLKSYFEIGVRSTPQNFDKINCPVKWGVDPEVTHHKVLKMTSDEHFERVFNNKVVMMEGQITFSLIFIDGYHSAEQVKKDFENSLKCLNDGGFIVIHDCLPKDESTTHVPRDSKQWHGNVYQFAMTLNQYDGIDFITYDFDEGCCVVWKDATKKALKGKIKPTWENYIKHRKEALNIVTITDAVPI